MRLLLSSSSWRQELCGGGEIKLGRCDPRLRLVVEEGVIGDGP